MKFTYDFAEINSKVPMIEFLDTLSIKERAKIFAYIDKLVELKSSGISPKEKETIGTVLLKCRCDIDGHFRKALNGADNEIHI